MNSWRFVLRSLRHHRRIHLAVALGVAAATAVLYGALIVGDSVRHSLKSLTIERLGKIDEILVTDRFFSSDLAERLKSAEEFEQHYADAVNLILFPSTTVELLNADRVRRSGNVNLIGGDSSFWSLDVTHLHDTPIPGEGEIVINQALADDLGIEATDINESSELRLAIRFPDANQVPAESPLGKKTERNRSLAQLRIVKIVPNQGLGRFSLQANQQAPRNAFLAPATLQDALDQQDRVNAVLIVGHDVERPASPSSSDQLKQWLHPQAADVGLLVQQVERPQLDVPPNSDEIRSAYRYIQMTSDRMLLSEEVEKTAARAFPAASQATAPTRLLTYLANEIARVVDRDQEPVEGIPFSVVTAVDFDDQFRPLSGVTGKPIPALGEGEIVLVDWAAKELGAEINDTIRLTYYLPETTHSEFEESHADFVLKDIVHLAKPDRGYNRRREAIYETEARTLVNDPNLTPTVPGFTDQETIDNDETPFPINRTIRGEDDDYWTDYRATPKAYISLAKGQALFGSRFGQLTALRFSDEQLTTEMIENTFLKQAKDDQLDLGLKFIPVKRQGLAASSGTTPFDALFFGLSFFIIAASLILVALLFRLGIERRAIELGLLQAVGYRSLRIFQLLILESTFVASLGAAFGLLIGAVYAKLMIFGLTTIWVDAISVPFLRYHWTAQSALIGYFAGVLVSIATISWSVRALRKLRTTRLLAGQTTPGQRSHARSTNRMKILVATLIGLGVALTSLPVLVDLGTEGQAGAFVGGGAALLTAMLVFIWGKLRTPRTDRSWVGRSPLVRLASRSAGRNPSRSTMTISMIATASFLIVAMSAFQLAPSQQGTGGFQLVAQASDPIFDDLNAPNVRQSYFADQAQLLQDTIILPLRLQPGDDASCNNLYQSRQPRVLGVTPKMVEHFRSSQGFKFAGTSAKTDAERANPWMLLGTEVRSDGPIPVILDKNTAMYSLHEGTRIGDEFEFEYGEKRIRFRVVGHLANSVLQGSLLIGEADFISNFPKIAGYRFFLIQTPNNQTTRVQAVLEDRLGDLGFDTTSTLETLKSLLAVQNTYLTTFQSLGALGLLLGTFGVATVQLRNVIERRGELALMRATGFSPSRLGRMVMYENTWLLLAGLFIGFLAALVAVLPHVLLSGARLPSLSFAMLGVVFLMGWLTSLITVRAVTQTPLLAALRQDR